MKLPPGFYMYPGRSLVAVLCDLGVQPRSYGQLKAQQRRSHQDQYERPMHSRIKSFRKEYRHLLRRYMPEPLIEPPLPTFERLPADRYERALHLVAVLRREMP
ncbi:MULTISPECIES: hypothetical protein [unclassified Variovorax]|jgi:hypothetical protein|uniref:hypothetical protein n=1 Tax=unclassified Variovorax TaxID=663243 RepID=UPI000F7DA163|nr:MULTISPECIES: hypothetical protein [unclassified Variovorax]RSZ47729.1 hypothetical protein EJO70_03780 [Variovorax sp. 553]RSZ48144.1 hypothetical protein EJO71_00205 [Variovorax sp. 679]